jgi:hypothetical protein
MKKKNFIITGIFAIAFLVMPLISNSSNSGCMVEACFVGGDGTKKCTTMHLFCIMPDENQYLGAYLSCEDVMPGWQQLLNCHLYQE